MRSEYLRTCILLLLAFSSACVGQEPAVRWGPEGQLVYAPDDNGNRIPDFSHCGYDQGDSPIPDVPARVVVEPGPGDDGSRIQAAISYVESLASDETGFRGAVVLVAGEFQVEGDLRIEASGIVVRGASAGPEGTTIVAAGQGRRPLFRIGTARVKDAENEVTTHVVDKYVSVGAKSLAVEDVESLKVGDRILITRPCTDEWIQVLGARTTGVGWRPGRCDITWDRMVTAIDENSIAIDAPLTTAIESRFGGATVSRVAKRQRTAKVGLEDLTLRSAVDSANPVDEQHSWHGVVANNAENGWVRRVRFQHFAGGAVLLREGTKQWTVEDCLMLAPISELGGYRRHSFFNQGQLNLFLRCHAEQGMHDFVVGHCAAGPQRVRELPRT